MTESAPNTTALLVCGNLDRCDDGAAIVASTMLRPAPPTGARIEVAVKRCGQLDVQHLLDVAPGVPVIIIDTAAGVPPGEIVTLTFDQLLAHPRGPAPHSSHALPIDQVIGIWRELSDQAVEGLFVGIGGSDFGFGRSLSTIVRRALPDFVAAINSAIGAHADRPARRSA